MPPVICTAPDDIPLHPSAPDFVDQGPEPGACVVMSSFALIAEHQHVMAVKARSESVKENARDQDKSSNAKIPKAQHVHHPRSKMARKVWAARVDAEGGQDATLTKSLVFEHDHSANAMAPTDPIAASSDIEQPSSEMDNGGVVHDKIAAESRDEDASNSPPASLSQLPPVDAPDDDVIAGQTDESATSADTEFAAATASVENPATFANISSQAPVSPGTDEELPLGTVRDRRTGALVVQWRMIQPAPVPTEETVLQPVSAPLQSSGARTLKNNDNVPSGKENNAVSPASGSGSLPRRSQRTLKRKRGDGEGIADRSMNA